MNAGGNVPFPPTSPPSLQSAVSTQRLGLSPGRGGQLPAASDLDTLDDADTSCPGSDPVTKL